MRVVFISSYLSIHQLPFCRYLSGLLGDDFCFVATKPVRPDRLANGYRDLDAEYSFVLRAYMDEATKEAALRRIEQADVVIHGSAAWEYVERRLKQGKLTFVYSERLYKTGVQWWKLPVRTIRFYKKYGRYKNLYLLCASAYTAGDFAKTHTFINKAYKWGYFPEMKRYDEIDRLLDRKKPASILWVGRFLDWKHPEAVVEVARRLQRNGYDFQIKMIGSGEVWDDTKRMVEEHNLQERVELLGAVASDQVRAYMEEASIYLFTSDRNEGWGAVLNESMNSACAVVASHAIGAVPFLLTDGENGLAYQSGNVDELYQKVQYLLDNPEYGRRIGETAYATIEDLWNAETAAQRLLKLAQALLDGEKRPRLYEEGPCSKAE